MATQANPVESVDERLARLRGGTKEQYVINFYTEQVHVRLLSIDEWNTVRKEARSERLEQNDSVESEHVYMQKRVLELASTGANGKIPELPMKLLGKMSLEEVAFLYEEYMNIVDKMDPRLKFMSQEEFVALVAALKKNTMSSKDLSTRQLRAICTAYQDLIQRVGDQT